MGVEWEHPSNPRAGSSPSPAPAEALAFPGASGEVFAAAAAAAAAAATEARLQALEAREEQLRHSEEALRCDAEALSELEEELMQKDVDLDGRERSCLEMEREYGRKLAAVNAVLADLERLGLPIRTIPEPGGGDDGDGVALTEETHARLLQLLRPDASGGPRSPGSSGRSPSCVSDWAGASEYSDRPGLPAEEPLPLGDEAGGGGHEAMTISLLVKEPVRVTRDELFRQQHGRCHGCGGPLPSGIILAHGYPRRHQG